MTVGGGFRRLTRTLRRIERAGWTVRDVRPETGDGLRQDDAICAVVDCRWRPSASLGANGSSARTPLVELESGSDGVTIDTLEVGDRDGLGREARLRVRAEIDGDAPDDVPQPEPSRPLHRDPERLESLYRRHGSFAEIAESIPEDVSAETIRRYTIEHGIHEPGGPGPRDERPADEGAATPVRANGHGLPEEIDLQALVDLVEQANTLYDVQRQLRLERDETAELLARYDLLDLVVRRIDQAGDREAKRETIEGRLRELHP